MTDLQPGYTIQTKGFKTVKVGQKLGEGGQGAVYEVDYDGKPKAFKWYSGKNFKNLEKFYVSLDNNIKTGRPTSAFLWPEDITEKNGEAFGYIIDLRLPEYKDFSKFLIGKESFASITAMVNAALRITAGFRALHLKGYRYQDLNDSDFFINPKNGDVLIDNNDYVASDGHENALNIRGNPRYMAPEIVRGEALPNMLSDCHTLSVVLFLLWTNNHPLEGKGAYLVCMDAKHEKRIYGENPVFIFDPGDDSNRPVQGIHRGAINAWPELPAYLREEFIKAFSKDVMADPNKRIIDQEWLRIFIRMRGEIYKCPCGNVYFADPVAPNQCPACKKTNSFPFYIKTRRYNLPLHQRTKLYACHTEKDSEDFETLTGEVAAANAAGAAGGAFKLKNVSAKNWTVTIDGGTTTLAPNAEVGLKKGMVIDFGGASAEIA